MKAEDIGRFITVSTPQGYIVRVKKDDVLDEIDLSDIIRFYGIQSIIQYVLAHPTIVNAAKRQIHLSCKALFYLWSMLRNDISEGDVKNLIDKE